jgi:hypothetical protein
VEQVGGSPETIPQIRPSYEPNRRELRDTCDRAVTLRSEAVIPTEPRLQVHAMSRRSVDLRSLLVSESRVRYRRKL